MITEIISLCIASFLVNGCASQKYKGMIIKKEEEAEFYVKKLENDLGKRAIKTKSGLQYIITKTGKGKKPKEGQTVYFHYIGKLIDDTIFDSSYNRYRKMEIIIGSGIVINGWDEGIRKLNVGSKATLIIPPWLGYSQDLLPQLGVNKKKPYLIYEVEILEII